MTTFSHIVALSFSADLILNKPKESKVGETLRTRSNLKNPQIQTSSGGEETETWLNC